jgi:hypothetical protein
MQKIDAEEAAPIMQRSLAALLAFMPSQGRAGSDVRTACGALSVNAELLIQNDQAGPPLANCFDLAFKAGISQPQLAAVRLQVFNETPKTVGGIMITNSIIELCLSTEGRVIAGISFTSREDVDLLKDQMNAVFANVEESTADEMDQMTYRVMVELHAAIIHHLVVTARPLPRVLQYVFAFPMPTLVLAQRLYADGSRGDEIRQENKIVHPAFAPASGIALSA